MPFITTDASQTEQVYTIQGSNHQFVLRKTALDQSDIRRASFERALGAVGRFYDVQRDVAADKDLSPMGRAKKLEPERARVVSTLTAAAAELSDVAAAADSAERAMLAPTPLDTTNAALATREATIFAWWAALDGKGRSNAMAQMASDPRAHAEVMLAVLHAPAMMRDEQTDRVARFWEAHQRAQQPEKAASIAAAREAVDWAQRGVNTLAGIANRFLGWKPEQILDAIVTQPDPKTHKAATIFGLSDTDVSIAKQRREAKANARRIFVAA